MTTRVEPRPVLRSDAERNRKRLLAAAREVFSEQGIDAPLEQIARRAEVGIGTLYRRFPSRTTLIEALFVEKARAYAEASVAALAADEPWEGLAGFIEHICELQAADRGFAEVLTASFPAARELHRQMTTAQKNTEKLIARARRAGAVRPDFVATDVFWILISNSAYLRVTRDVAPNAWRRYTALILDALRTPGTGKLPPSLTGRQLDKAVEAVGLCV